MNRKLNGWKGFRSFAKGSFPVKIYLILSFLWYPALESSIFLVYQRPWKPGAVTFTGILILFLFLFFIRSADEIKDYEYDKINNPERPLIQGEISHGDLWLYIALAFCLMAAITAPVSFTAWLVFFLDMLFGLFLMWIEKVSKKVKDGTFLNLFVTYPINVGLSLCFTVWVCENTGIVWDLRMIPAVLIFAAGFLFFEFIRKTTWVKNEKKTLYSNEIGTKGSLFLAVLFGFFGTFFAVGTGLASSPVSPALYGVYYIPLIALVPVGKALVYCLKFKNKGEKMQTARLGSYGRWYIVALYGALVVRGLILAVL